MRTTSRNGGKQCVRKEALRVTFYWSVSTHNSKATESWCRNQIETRSALLALCAGNSPITGEFPSQRPVTRSFEVFFDIRLNKRLGKQSRSRRFFRRHCAHYDVTVRKIVVIPFVAIRSLSFLHTLRQNSSRVICEFWSDYLKNNHERILYNVPSVANPTTLDLTNSTHTHIYIYIYMNDVMASSNGNISA